MKISTTAALEAPFNKPTLLRGTLPDVIRRTAEMGYDGIEIQWHLTEAEDLNPALVREQCAAHGIAVSAYATGSLYTREGLSLIDERRYIGDEVLRRLGLYIDAAAVTGGKVIIGCLRGNLDPGRSVDSQMVLLAERLKRCLDLADKKQVGVVLEATNRYENNYIATARQCMDFIERFRLDGLQILLDTFHMNFEEEDLRAAIMTAAPRLGHIHFADNVRTCPGSGAMDLPAVYGWLREAGYDEWLSLECCVAKDENQEARDSLRYLKGFVH